MKSGWFVCMSLIGLCVASGCGSDDSDAGKLSGKTNSTASGRDGGSSDVAGMKNASSDAGKATGAGVESDVPTSAEGGSGTAGASGGPRDSGAVSSSGGATVVDDGKPPTDSDGLYHCPSVIDLTHDVVLSGDYVGDQHWSGIIRIEDDVTVSDGIVTIDPGTLFIANNGASLAFGTGEMAPLVLHAQGTEEQPLRFCGSHPEPGSWSGLSLLTHLAEESVVENWLVDGAGSNGDAAVILTGEVVLKNVQIRGSGGDGLAAATFHEGSEGIVIEGARNNAVVLEGVDACNRFPTGSTIKNNGNNVALVALDTLLDAEQLTFHAIGIPYLQQGDFVARGGSCTFEAGVEYRFGPGANFELGKLGGSVALHINGTESEPVVFRGAEPTKGYWGGFIVDASTLTTSTISHAVFSHGGGANIYPLTIRSSITLNDVTIKDNAAGGQLTAPLQSGSVGLSSLGNDGFALSVTVEALVGLPAGGTISDNGKNMIAVARRASGPAVIGTIRKLGVPYRAESISFTDDGDSVVIEAGTEFVFAPQAMLEIGAYNTTGTLVALGTADHPIVLRGESGVNGLNDGWGGVVFNGNVSADSRLDYVTVIAAGLSLLRPIAVEHSTFIRSAGYGITKLSSDVSDYQATNTFTENANGDVGNF